MDNSIPNEGKRRMCEKFVEFLALVKQQTGPKLEVFHKDGKIENVSTESWDIVKFRGTRPGQMCAYAPAQNGAGDGMIRPPLYMLQTFLKHKSGTGKF